MTSKPYNCAEYDNEDWYYIMTECDKHPEKEEELICQSKTCNSVTPLDQCHLDRCVDACQSNDQDPVCYLHFQRFVHETDSSGPEVEEYSCSAFESEEWEYIITVEDEIPDEYECTTYMSEDQCADDSIDYIDLDELGSALFYVFPDFRQCPYITCPSIG